MATFNEDPLSVQARCPVCRAISNFVPVEVTPNRDNVRDAPTIACHAHEHRQFFLMKCVGCGLGGIARFYVDTKPWGNVLQLIDFYPEAATLPLKLPEDAPEDIVSEFREAEKCANADAYRAGCVMLRSVIEKTLKANGYNTRKHRLLRCIKLAGVEGAITTPFAELAEEKIKDIADDILHEDRREIDQGVFAKAQEYTQRLLELLYNHRESVVKHLKSKRRLKEDGGPAEEDPAEPEDGGGEPA